MIITIETSGVVFMSPLRGLILRCRDFYNHYTPSGFLIVCGRISIIITPRWGFEGEAIYQQHLKDLEELKKSILQKAFNGELKQNNPEGME